MLRNDGHCYAGLWPRFLALCTDLVVLSALFFPVTKIIKGTWFMTSADHDWHYGRVITDPLCFVFLGVMLLYFIIFEGLAGATPGKVVIGLRVIRIDGKKPGLGRSTIRNILRLVDGLPALNILGIVLILSSRERVRFGDRMAGTRVIKTPNRIFGIISFVRE